MSTTTPTLTSRARAIEAKFNIFGVGGDATGRRKVELAIKHLCSVAVFLDGHDSAMYHDGSEGYLAKKNILANKYLCLHASKKGLMNSDIKGAELVQELFAVDKVLVEEAMRLYGKDAIPAN